MSENEIIDALFFDFIGDLCERLKYVKVCCKGDQDGDDDGLFWHFTRLSALKSMLEGRELWLSDLAFSNDADEIVFGLNRVPPIAKEISSRWGRENAHLVKAVRRLANETIQTFRSAHHAYAFCLSDERDTAQHWNEYGGGLRTIPAADDPAVAVGFLGEALFHPLELSSEEPLIFLINTVSGGQAVDHLIQYWTIKARKALEVLEKRRGDVSVREIYSLLRHMLVLACALGKNEGWRDEHEYRLLYITKNFGEEHNIFREKPAGQGRYAPLKWAAGHAPVRVVTPHPLAEVAVVERQLRLLPEGGGISIIPSTLKPRPRR